MPYVEAVRKLAIEKNVPLIDLYAMTLVQAEQLGPAGSAGLGRKAPDGKLDTTHLGPSGQREIGIMAARELARLEPALKPYLHDLVAWKDAMRQPGAWYGGAEAVRIIDMAMPLGPRQRARHTTIDNQMQYMAKVYTTKDEQ